MPQLLRDKARQLIATANSLLALATSLEADAELGMDGMASAVHVFKNDTTQFGGKARRLYDDRRRRSMVFGDPTLFAEPVWDILLDLFIATTEQKRIAVTSACIAADVPASTALRWISVMVEKGLIVRESDPDDNRRVFVRLTATGYARMVNYLAEA